MKIKELLEQPEGRKIEFKSQLPTSADICKTVVAFANDAGGILFVGIQDKPRKVIGVDEYDLIKLEEQISNIIHDNCNPVILPEIMFLKYENKHIIAVKIYKGSNPPYYIRSKGVGSGTYIRVGSSNHLANEEIIKELERQKENISFDSLPVLKKGLTDIDFHSFRKQFKEIIQENLDNIVLKKLNLVINEQGNLFPTNALILLSDDDLRNQLFPYAKIECALFKGTVPGDFIDQKTIDTPLSFQADEAYKFILRHISQGSHYEGVYRKDRWEYPVVAIREVIRNAVIHRDYSLTGKDIKIAIFDDKIEITSPGKLLPTVDFDDMEAGQSDIRNKTLAPVFKKLGIIEQWGNGLQLVANELKKYPEIDFQWSEPGIAFRVSFIKKNFNGRLPSDTVGKTSEKRRIPSESTDQEKTVLKYLIKNKIIKSAQVEKLLKIKESRTRELLKQMVNKKLISRKGKGRSTYYCIPEDGGNYE